MLFKKEIEPRCGYCGRGTLVDEDTVTCLKRGVVHPSGSCRHFRYDPLKRTPARPASPDFSKLKTEDFTL